MAESNESVQNDVYSANDPLDINELASLNEDISPELIEQLQSKLSGQVQAENTNDDSTLFEETTAKEKTTSSKFNDSDDNFIKKYKAKLKKKQENMYPAGIESKTDQDTEESVDETENKLAEEEEQNTSTDSIEPVVEESTVPLSAENQEQNNAVEKTTQTEEIENIKEFPINNEDIEYKNNLDYLDNNIKYSKYVIYIDPENKDFIDSLTVKERKNLINKIIREQDDIAITKHKIGKFQNIFVHILITLFTLTIAIPSFYKVFNMSIESIIDNHNAASAAWKTLYKDTSKLKKQQVKRTH